jgi:hypothetical protein
MRRFELVTGPGTAESVVEYDSTLDWYGLKYVV